MSKPSSTSRRNHDDPTIEDGGGGEVLEGTADHYGRTNGRRSRPPITGLHDVLRPILDKLTSTGISRSLQENTIIGIVERHIFGEGFDKALFWEQAGFPNVRTYKSWRAADPTGSDPTSFVAVLEEAKTAANRWRSAQAVHRVEMAHDLLQHFAPELVESLITIALDSKNDFARLQAATAGLDRASARVAPKGQTTVNLPGLEDAISKIYGGVDLEDTAEDDT